MGELLSWSVVCRGGGVRLAEGGGNGNNTSTIYDHIPSVSHARAQGLEFASLERGEGKRQRGRHLLQL